MELATLCRNKASNNSGLDLQITHLTTNWKGKSKSKSKKIKSFRFLWKDSAVEGNCQIPKIHHHNCLEAHVLRHDFCAKSTVLQTAKITTAI